MVRIPSGGRLGLAVLAGAIAAAGAVQAQQAPPPQAQFGPRVQKPAGPVQPSQQIQAAVTGQATAPPRGQSKAETVATHGDWQIQCNEVQAPPAAAAAQPAPAAQAGAQPAKPAAKPPLKPAIAAAPGQPQSAPPAAAEPAAEEPPQKVRQCGMTQTARNEERQNFVLNLFLLKQRQGDKVVTLMRVLAPVGVFLPTGVALEIDGAAIARVPFERCLPQVCLARAEGSPQTVDKMKKGGGANFIVYEAPGRGIAFKVSLKGFAPAYDALDKLL